MKFDILEQPFRCRTKDTLRFQEMKIAIEQIYNGKTWAEIEKMSEEENLFRAASKSRAIEIYNIIKRRLVKVDRYHDIAYDR